MFALTFTSSWFTVLLLVNFLPVIPRDTPHPSCILLMLMLNAGRKATQDHSVSARLSPNPRVQIHIVALTPAQCVPSLLAKDG